MGETFPNDRRRMTEPTPLRKTEPAVPCCPTSKTSAFASPSRSPLARLPAWVRYPQICRRDNTMPQWARSMLVLLRYLDPRKHQRRMDRKRSGTGCPSIYT